MTHKFKVITHNLWVIFRISLVITYNSGCYYHPGCCVPDDKIKDAEDKRFQWEKKKAFFKKTGVLHVMRECTWRKFKRSQLDLPVDTALARILHVDTEETLLQGIIDETLFGFLCCDVETPVEKIKEYEAAGYLFPPVISRMDLSDKHRTCANGTWRNIKSLPIQ